MKQAFLPIFIFIMTGYLSGCSEEASDLEIQSSSVANLISGDTYSCLARHDTSSVVVPRDVTGPYYLTFRKMNLIWKSSDFLEIMSVQLVIDHPQLGGRILKQLDPFEVNHLFGGNTGVVTVGTGDAAREIFRNGTIIPIHKVADKDVYVEADHAVTTIESVDLCNINIGGFSIDDPERGFTATAEIRISAARLLRDEEGEDTLEQKSVTSTHQIDVEFPGF